jgi:hypothetical protein
VTRDPRGPEQGREVSTGKRNEDGKIEKEEEREGKGKKGEGRRTFIKRLAIYPVSAVLTAVSTKPSRPEIAWNKNSVALSPL